VRQSLSILMPS
jgi:hypothetical protein